MAAGEFDDLPGAGKPLDLRDADDPDWWVRRKIADERLEAELAEAPTLTVFALRREAKGFPESLRHLGDEARVREVLDDYNARVKRDRLLPSVDLPASLGRVVLAPLIDVDEMVERWRRMR